MTAPAGRRQIIGRMGVRALSWNLFHGRDHPPERELHTWRSRLLRTTVRGTSHAQVNRELFGEFAAVLAGADWDVALLQECPPRWAEPLATECRAEPHLVPTSRNLPRLGRVQGAVAAFNPDLIASWEGGSNLTLVRGGGIGDAAIAERRMVRLALRPERRVMALSRLASGLCVANYHASTDREAAEGELGRAAGIAADWAAGSPLLLGGDFNLKARRSEALFDRLERDHGLRAPTGTGSIDHLLVSGAEIAEPTSPWSPDGREVPEPDPKGGPSLPIRLSDHTPVEATLILPR
jgi:endonuclease/exonuclease/phosphatase family metal-dependent hydrolase